MMLKTSVVVVALVLAGCGPSLEEQAQRDRLRRENEAENARLRAEEERGAAEVAKEREATLAHLRAGYGEMKREALERQRKLDAEREAADEETRLAQAEHLACQQSPACQRDELRMDICTELERRQSITDEIREENHYASAVGVVNLQHLQELKVQLQESDEQSRGAMAYWRKSTGKRFNVDHECHVNLQSTLRRGKP